MAAPFTFEGVSYVAGDIFDQAFTQGDLQAILEDANLGNTGAMINPFGGLNDDGDCFDVVNGLVLLDSVAIGGVAKQTAEAGTAPEPVEPGDDEGSETAQVVTSDTAVSGYNAVNGVEVAYFDEWYLPIVQTNCGPGGCWDTVIRVANLDALNNAVTIRFFPADDGSGSLQTGFQIQDLVDGGTTWNVNLSDLVPEGWVGTAHVYSDGAVFAMADRYKVGYNMWVTNTGSSADFERGDDLIPGAQVPGSNGRFALFAPHVLLDYFGWNTGINVANLVNADNNVSIQYFNLLGNATEVLNQRLSAHGMTYFYDPSIGAQDNNQQDVTTDPNAGVVGSAIIWSDAPVAAVVDATKYPETDPHGDGADLFQATSYSATANVFTWQAVPLVQKGNAIDGSGATSGINVMNPNATAVTADVHWVNPSGFGADNFGVSSVTIPGFANGFVYTLWQHNLPNGFLGSAQVVASAPVAAVSANVNYDVDGDGSAIFNAFNPCGFFRVGGACSFGDPFEPGGQSITKTFVDAAGDAVAGVNFTIVNTEGSANYQATSVSGLDGSRTFSNVPVGVYELLVNSVPAGYVLPTGAQETIVVTEGADVEVINTLEFNNSFTKTVVVAGTLGVDGEITADTVTLTGIEVVVYEQAGTDGGGDPIVGEIVFEGVTGADGSVGATVAPGNYVLCISDANGDAVTSDGATFEVNLAGPDCEVFPVVADAVTPLVNEVDGVTVTEVTAANPGGTAIATQNTNSGTNTASAAFVTGPGTPPEGVGSLEYTIGPDGWSEAQLQFSEYDGTLVDDITTLSYSTYVDSTSTAVDAQGRFFANYLALYIDTDGVAGYEDILFFAPNLQTPAPGSVTQGTWQPWDALTGSWWSLNSGTYTQATPGTFAQVTGELTGTPTIAESGIRVSAGYGVDWAGFVGNVDAITIGVNDVDTLYDLEP